MKGLWVLLLATSITMVSAQTKLKIGDKAPAFTGKDQDGKSISLSSFAGKKVVLYFYPKDQTPGCTTEACNLRDNIDMLTQQGYVVLGVSTDDEASHRAFREKYNLPFTLIADTDKSINQSYGVWVEREREGKKFMGTARTTFLIDEKGVITDIIEKVDTANHADQIVKGSAKN
jgi:peroxiredoxin Q/BCP